MVLLIPFAESAAKGGQFSEQQSGMYVITPDTGDEWSVGADGWLIQN